MSAILAPALGFASSMLGNAFNAANMDKQMKFAWDMFNATNKYNSPVNQMNRLRNAGLNPANMVGSVSPGVASSTSPASSPTPFVPDVAGDITKGKQAELADAQADQVKSQTRLNDVEAETKYQKNMADILLSLRQSGLIKQETMSKLIENSFKPSQMSLDIEGSELRNKYQKFQNDLVEVQRYLQDIELAFLPQKLSREMLMMSADIDLKRANTDNVRLQYKYLEKQIDKIVWDMKPTIEKDLGRKLTTKESNQLFDYLLQYKASEAERMYNNAGPEGGQGVYNMLYGTQRDLKNLFRNSK